MLASEVREVFLSNQPFIAPSKKLLPLMILEILKSYTDSDHRLSQRDIQDILLAEYDMKVDRKAVKRNITSLIEMGYPIQYSEAVRVARNPKSGMKEDVFIISDLWIERDFTESELRLLIDSLVFSRHLPHTQCQELAKKLSGLASKYFESHIKHIWTMEDAKPHNPQLFYTIEILDEAISRGLKVRFKYLTYGKDKKQHARCRQDGTVREYLINPYQMVAKDGKYYLICNYDRYDEISNYRIDRIADIELIDEPIKPFAVLTGVGSSGLDLADYMAAHGFMFAGSTVVCELWIEKWMLDDVIDFFGFSFDIYDEDESGYYLRSHVNGTALEQFAENYGPYVVVLRPKEVAASIVSRAKATIERYGEQVKEDS